MSIKQYDLPEIGIVKLYKRRNTRSIKITVTRDNQVRVTMPTWMPHAAGVQYVKSKKNWISAHQMPIEHLADGLAIGKAHRLRYIIDKAIEKPSSRITKTEIHIVVQSDNQITNPLVQKTARQACIRALRQEANNLLPIRYKQIAKKYGFSCNDVPRVRHLKARWGSCSHQKDVTLNLFLMQLPWDLIDYVILHELVHTKVLNHGTNFWNELEKYLPSGKILRKRLKGYQPTF